MERPDNRVVDATSDCAAIVCEDTPRPIGCSSIFDDGSTTRLAQTRYFMTTTTAQAGEVMSWIEFLLQTATTITLDVGVFVSRIARS
jgi:hypothetical protein